MTKDIVFIICYSSGGAPLGLALTNLTLDWLSNNTALVDRKFCSSRQGNLVILYVIINTVYKLIKKHLRELSLTICIFMRRSVGQDWPNSVPLKGLRYNWHIEKITLILTFHLHHVLKGIIHRSRSNRKTKVLIASRPSHSFNFNTSLERPSRAPPPPCWPVKVLVPQIYCDFRAGRGRRRCGGRSSVASSAFSSLLRVLAFIVLVATRLIGSTQCTVYVRLWAGEYYIAS